MSWTDLGFAGEPPRKSLFGTMSAGRAEEAYRITPVTPPEHDVADLTKYADRAISRLQQMLDDHPAEIAALAMHRCATLGVAEYGTAAFEKDNETDTLEELADAVFYVACDMYQLDQALDAEFPRD